MNCELYQKLSPKEKCDMIGKVVHLLQNDTSSFLNCVYMVSQAEAHGKFDEVVINPPTPTTENY